MKYLKQHNTKAHQTGIPKEMPFLIRELKLSRHSKKRMQQRGIPKEVPFLIKEYGESINTHEDKKYFCNKKTLKKIIRLENGKSILKRFEKYLLNTAIVCNEGVCITVMKINENNMLRRN